MLTRKPKFRGLLKIQLIIDRIVLELFGLTKAMRNKALT